MPGKKLTNIALFIAGNASKTIPSRAFMSYGIASGKAKKENCIYDIPDVDAKKTVNDLWNESIIQIKENEGIV